MARPTRGARSRATRALRSRILNAAEVEFAMHGFAETKVLWVSRRSGHSDTTVRRQFVGKMGLWNELHSARMAEMVVHVEAARSAVRGDLIEELLAGLRGVIDFFDSRPLYLEMQVVGGISWATADFHELGRGSQTATWGSGRDMLRGMLERAAQDGLLPALDPAIATGLVIGSMQVWLTDWLDQGRPRPASEVADDVCAYVRQLLQPIRTCDR